MRQKLYNAIIPIFAYLHSVVSVDECSLGVHNCPPNADCFDEVDGYSCVCQSGYRPDGDICIGMNTTWKICINLNNDRLSCM